jgi:hypothetical protein
MAEWSVCERCCILEAGQSGELTKEIGLPVPSVEGWGDTAMGQKLTIRAVKSHGNKHTTEK